MQAELHVPSPSSVNSQHIADLLTLITANQTFVVTSHARPDGDAIGSALGVMHLLESLGKQVTVCFADPIPAIFACLPGVDRILAHPPEAPADVAVLLECDSVARSGFNHIPAATKINIDHHLSGQPFADFNWIDPSACAVGEMIYEVAIAAGVDITSEMAVCLYAAILTDTGSFMFPSTKASTFGIAQHLVESGADAGRIAGEIYFSVAPSRIRLLGVALSNMRMEGEIAWSSVSQAEIQQAEASIEDCEGVVNYLIGMAGVCAAAFLREVAPGDQFRLSLRSKGSIDVAAVAEQFGGGGHRNASGCTVDGSLQSVSSRVIGQLGDACRDRLRES